MDIHGSVQLQNTSASIWTYCSLLPANKSLTSCTCSVNWGSILFKNDMWNRLHWNWLPYKPRKEKHPHCTASRSIRIMNGIRIAKRRKQLPRDRRHDTLNAMITKDWLSDDYIIPAPSPEILSAEEAPLCSIQDNAWRACLIVAWVGTLLCKTSENEININYDK